MKLETAPPARTELKAYRPRRLGGSSIVGRPPIPKCAMYSGCYSIPGESRFLRPFLYPATASPMKQRSIIAQTRQFGNGLRPIHFEADAGPGVGLSEFAGGGKRPRLWNDMTRVLVGCDFDGSAAARLARAASGAPAPNINQLR